MPEGSDVFSRDPCLQITLLGPPQVKRAGYSLPVPRRTVRAMLYYLADQAKPVSRAQLCLLFWPDIPEGNARRNLTRLLTHLRRALPLPELLVATEDRVNLDERAFWCDAVEFRHLSDGEHRWQSLQHAAELYAGPFLAGFDLPSCPDYENWLTQERLALENRYLKVLSELIEIEIDEQDYAKAIRYAQRYLEIDALTEEIHRRLIALYALTGDRARALRQYETCITVLENELGARPLPETQAVYQAVLDGRQPILKPELVEIVYPASLKSLRLDVPMVGRSTALQHLIRVQQMVKAGMSKLVLISGETGVGKSRLLYEFIRHGPFQHQVMIGTGQPGERAVPYSPIVEALRSTPVPDPISLPAFWLAEMTRLLPELSDLYPNLPPPFSLKGEEARLRLFDALCHYLFAVQEELGALLVCFDDLHWFDRTSLSWLSHLCRQLLSKKRPIMVIGTYRTEDAEQVRELRDNLARLGILDEVKLAGLDAESILELFQFVYGPGTGSESLACRLQEATGGNPFFILEILLALGEEGKLPGEGRDLSAFPLPDSVREAVGRRIWRLNPRCRQVLEAGAVLSSPFSFKALLLTAGRSELETALSLEVLIARQLLLEKAGRYSFRHDLIRRVTLDGVNPVRLRILHARAGKALEKLEPESFAALARHFDAVGEQQKALHYYDLSARRAEALFAWQETEAYLKRMLELLEAPGLPENQKTHSAWQVQVLAKLIHIYYLQGKLAERDEGLHQLEALTSASGDQALQLQAIELSVQQLNNDARYREAIAEARKGLALLHNCPNAASRGRLQAQVGFAYLLLGQPRQALEAFQEAQSCTKEYSDLELRAVVLTNLGLVHRVIGDHQQALQYYQKAFDCHQQLGDPYSVARYVDIGFLYTNLCRFTEAKQFLDECLEVSRKAGVRIYEGHALLALGGWHLYGGNPVAALVNLQHALKILETLRNQDLTASAKALLGFAFYHLADLKNSRKWLEDSLALSREIDHQIQVALALIQMAILDIAAGHFSVAREELKTGLAIACTVQSKELVLASLIATARLERQSASPALAKEHAAEALRSLQGLYLTGLEIWANVEAGLALADLGELEAALAHTGAAVLLIPRAHQLWIPFEQVHLAHARVLHWSGNLAAAEEQERCAKAIYQAKATRIHDPAQRRRFSVAFLSELSNLPPPLKPAD